MKLTLRPVFDGRIRSPGPRCWWLAVVRPSARPRPVRNTRRPRVERSRAFFRCLSLLWTPCVCSIRLTYTLLSHRRTASVFFFFEKLNVTYDPVVAYSQNRDICPFANPSRGDRIVPPITTEPDVRESASSSRPCSCRPVANAQYYCFWNKI